MLVQIAYFTADWCGPCKVFGPRLQRFCEDNGIGVMKIDADKETGLVNKFGVMSLPTTVWALNGDPVEVLTGAVTEEKLQQTLDRVRTNG